MASTPSLPVSLLIASKSNSIGNEPQKKTREDWRKAKELEEARKAGTAPAAVDEEGNIQEFFVTIQHLSITLVILLKQEKTSIPTFHNIFLLPRGIIILLDQL